MRATWGSSILAGFQTWNLTLSTLNLSSVQFYGNKQQFYGYDNNWQDACVVAEQQYMYYYK